MTGRVISKWAGKLRDPETLSDRAESLSKQGRHAEAARAHSEAAGAYFVAA